MSQDLPVPPVESVAARRARLRESLIWGWERRVRATGDNLHRLAIGVALAAALAVACVGWSFVQSLVSR